VTADSDGQFKLWDIRTFECVQSFEPSTPIGELVSFTSAGPHNQIIAGGSRLAVFEYDKPGTPWLTMQNTIVCAIYNEISCTVLTASGDTIKV
jgi:hypothetical protein